MLLAIDPGPERSAWVVFDGSRVIGHGKEPNDLLRISLAHISAAKGVTVVIEEITSYGMPVGREVFQTVRWAGRLEERAMQYGYLIEYLPRRDVKLHLCQSDRAKDANVRQALLDRFGGKDAAVGKKAAPGPLYGVKADEWAALGVAVTWWDLHRSAVQVAS